MERPITNMAFQQHVSDVPVLNIGTGIIGGIYFDLDLFLFAFGFLLNFTGFDNIRSPIIVLSVQPTLT